MFLKVLHEITTGLTWLVGLLFLVQGVLPKKNPAHTTIGVVWLITNVVLIPLAVGQVFYQRPKFESSLILHFVFGGGYFICALVFAFQGMRRSSTNFAGHHKKPLAFLTGILLVAAMVFGIMNG